MQIIAITNQKGGSGKTSLAINLGCALTTLGKRVILLDLDPSASLSYSFGINSPDGSIAEVLQGTKAIHTILIEREGLSIAPSSISLADVAVNMINKIGRENVLKDHIQRLKNFDYLFIDCPPSLSLLTINALNASDTVLIPTQVEVLSLQGLSQLLNTIEDVRRVLNKSLKVRGIVACMYDQRRKLSGEALKHIQGHIKEKIFTTVVRENVRIAEAPSFSQSVISHSPDSHGKEDYLALAKEFLKQEKSRT